MRQQYWDLARDVLAEGRALWLTRNALKLVAVPIGQRIGRPLVGPIHGGMLVTYRCNNRCLMCEYPQRAQRFRGAGRRELDTATMRGFVDGFAELGTTGISFFGGEPTVRKDLLELVAYAAGRGLLTSVTTNGNRLDDEAYAQGLLATGVSMINVSVDGATAARHDALRGYTGGFDRLSAGIRNLARLRERLGSSAQIVVVSVISPSNVREVPDIARLAMALGADRVGFMPVHLYDFSHESLRCDTPEFLDDVRRAVAWLKTHRDEYRLDSSDEYLDRFVARFRGEPSDIECHTGYFSLTVDCYGNYYPCDPYQEWGRSIGNALEVPIPDFWTSAQLAAARREMARCRKCIWNCTTELNLAIAAASPRRRGSSNPPALRA